VTAPPVVPSRPQGPTPAGVWVPTVFFLVAGVLDLVLRVIDLEHVSFWPVWQALGSLLMHWLVAAGLWRRTVICRAVAMVYCIASIIVYVFALALAYSQAAAAVRFPASVVVQSLFQIPSCALLLPYLRSPRASVLYTQPLF
jgi:hypothetical protein